MQKNFKQQDDQNNINASVYTYMTVLTNKWYLDGVKVLNESLKMVASTYPLLALVPASIDTEILRQLEENNIAYQVIPDFTEKYLPKKIKFLIGEKHFLN